MVERSSCLSNHIFSFVNVVDLVLEQHDSLLRLFSICKFLDHFMHSGQPGVEILDNVVKLQTIDLIIDLGL